MGEKAGAEMLGDVTCCRELRWKRVNNRKENNQQPLQTLPADSGSGGEESVGRKMSITAETQLKVGDVAQRNNSRGWALNQQPSGVGLFWGICTNLVRLKQIMMI